MEGGVTLSQVSEPSIISTLNKFESTKVQLSQVQLKKKGTTKVFNKNKNIYLKYAWESFISLDSYVVVVEGEFTFRV